MDKYVRFDWAMKRMLRDKANFAILEGLLTVLLEEPIHILEILESEGNQQSEDDKFNRVDIKAKDELVISTKQENAILHKLPAKIFPEYYLIRVNEFNQVAKTPLEEWISYLKNGVIRPDTTTPGLVEAREKLQYYNMSSEERHAYDEHINAIMIQNDVLNSAKLEGKIEGRIEGMAEGKAKGKAEEKREIAKKTKSDRNLHRANQTSYRFK